MVFSTLRNLIRSRTHQRHANHLQRRRKESITPVSAVQSLEDRCLLTNLIAGHFTQAGEFSTGSSNEIVAHEVADINGDGNLDVVGLDITANGIALLNGDGTGQLGASQFFEANPGGSTANPQSFGVADFDGDLQLDVVVGEFLQDRVTFFTNDGNGGFQAPTRVAVSGQVRPRGISIGDVNSDSTPDLVLNYFDGRFHGGDFSVWLNPDASSFPETSRQQIGAGGSLAVELGHFNGDAHLDAVMSTGHANIGIAIGNGDGTFQPITLISTGTLTNSINLETGDFDQNGTLDVIVTDRDGPAKFMLGDGSGSFTPGPSLSTPSFSSSIRGADFDADGDIDFVGNSFTRVAGEYVAGDDLYILRNDGDLNSLVLVETLVEPAISDVRIADYNNDGLADFSVAGITGGISVYVSAAAAPTILSLTASPNPVLQGQDLTLTANGVSDSGTVANVTFYHDVNGNGLLDPGTDSLFGIDTNGSDGWSVTEPVTGMPAGTHTFLAQAEDSIGQISNVVATISEVASAVYWDGDAGDFVWSNPLNWNTDTLPGIGDDVVVSVPADITVQINGNVSVQSIHSEESLNLDQSALTITAGSTVNGSFTSAGGTITANGDAASLAFVGGAAIDTTNLFALNGGSLIFGTGSLYTTNAGLHRTIEANGEGSLIDFSQFSSFTGTTGTQGHTTFYTSLNAFAGGKIDLSNATSIHDQTYVRAAGQDSQGVGSTIALTSLTDLAGGGRGQIVSASDTGIVELPVVESISASTLLASAGATLDLATATQYVGGISFHNTVQADGENSEINLSGLTSFVGATGVQGHTTFYTNINAFNGGLVDLSTAQSISNQTTINANGQDSQSVPSQIDLVSLTQLAGGARGQKVSVADVGVVSTPILNSIVHSSLSASNGATLDLSSVTTFDGGNGFTHTIQADGENSVVDLSNVTTFVGTTGSQGHTTFFTDVNALNGGTVDLANITTSSNQLRFSASGQDSQGQPSLVDLQSLVSMTGNLIKSISVANFGLIDLSSIITLHGTNLSATDGGQLDISTLVDYHGSSVVNNTFNSDGIGSVIDISSLQTLEGNIGNQGHSVWYLTIQSTDSGLINLGVGNNDVSRRVSLVSETGSIIAGQLNVLPGSTFAAVGTLTSDLTVESDFRIGIANGGLAGMFTVDGSYEQLSAGVLHLQLGGTIAGTEHDQLNVSGAAVLDGTISIAGLNGFLPSIGEAFDVLSYGGVSGDFSEYLGLDLGSGLTVQTDSGGKTLVGGLEIQPPPDAVEWKVSEGGNGHFYWLSDSVGTWYDAETEAAVTGSHLASIADVAENDFLVQHLLTSNERYWIGFTDADDQGTTEGQFVWSSGEPVTYTNWVPGEPNNQSNEDWALIRSDGTWNDGRFNSITQERGIIEFAPILTEPVVVEVADRGQLISGGSGNNDAVQIVVPLNEATDATIESEFDAYQAHLDAGNALVPFDLTTLGVSLVGFERLERLLEFESYRGVYVNPIVGTNSSQTLTGTEDADLIVGLGGNDSLVGLGGNDILIGSTGNDVNDGGDGDDVFLFSGTSNGFDTFVSGDGTDAAIGVTSATLIGLNGYTNGVEEFSGPGDTVIRDTNSSRTLDFSNTLISGIVEIDAAGGNDIISASNLSDGVYRGGSGNDSQIAGDGSATWLYSGSANGYDSFTNGTGFTSAIAETTGTIIGVNGYVNGVDSLIGLGDTVVRDTNSSRTLDFSNTVLTDVVEIDAAGGNDIVTASNLSDASYRGGSGNDTLNAGTANVDWLFNSGSNGFDTFNNGTGVTSAIAETPGTVIGVNGYSNGINSFIGQGDTVVRDTNSSRTLDFSNTLLTGLAEIDAAGGNDTITASELSDGVYRGGSGNDIQTAGSTTVTWLYSGTANGYDTLTNGTGLTTAHAETAGTIIGINGYSNGVDEFFGQSDTVIRDTNSSRTLDFSSTSLNGIAEVDAAGGNDVVTASDLSDAVYRGGSGNDVLNGGIANVSWLYDGSANGYDTFNNDVGTASAFAETPGTIIGVNGFANGVNRFFGQGDTIIRDTNSSRTLNFSDTVLTGISEIDAAGGNDVITASDLSDGIYRGGSGNDSLMAGSSAVTWLYSGAGNGFDTFSNGSSAVAVAETAGTIIGINGYANGVDSFTGTGDTIIRDTNSSRTLDFSNTALVGIAEVDAAGGNDVIVTSALTTAVYRGGSGNDRFVIQHSDPTVQTQIADFNAAGIDRIDLQHLELSGGFADLQLSQDGSDTAVSIPLALNLKLVDTVFGDLDEEDFLF